jgi:hypothetical protein
MFDWLKNHAWMVVIASVLAGVVTGLAGVVVLVTLPEDHFVSTKERPAVPLIWQILKNVLGGCIVIVGIIMSLPLVPGPGVAMVIIGLSLMNFPGKRRLELRILRAPMALGAINWLRLKWGRPPLRLSESNG